MSLQDNQINEKPGPFQVNFNIYNYKDILPSWREYCKHDEFINQRSHEKGNLEEQIWKRHVPTPQEIGSQEFRSQEVRRILKTGAWIWVKDYPIWIPPPYYFALQYGCAGAADIQFRLKRLKHVYFKLQARANPGCIGTLTVKNRGDGETTMAITDGLWECMDGVMDVGQVGIQSKTRDDSINPCWLYIQTLWQSLDEWVKEELFSDFASGDAIAEKLRFMRNKDSLNGITARNVLYTFYPAVYNAMDSKHDIKKCLLDEVLKWVQCDFGVTFINYKKFIIPGFERRGIFDMFSTPPDKDCQSYRDGYDLWQKSDPAQIGPNGTTLSRIHRYWSNPLEGIAGGYDMYGDADPQRIYDFIQAERKAIDKKLLPGEIRAFALDENEMWGTLDGGSVWSNSEGIKERKIFTIGHHFKDELTQEPARLYGNLEWHEGVIDTDVDFRMTDLTEFDKDHARFCFSYLPQNKEKLTYTPGEAPRPIPPKIIQDCLGVDPFNFRYVPKDGSKASDHAMVNRKFLDILGTGIVKCPTMIYCMRPDHQEIAFEDTLKAAVFNRALIQYENRSDKFANYAEDRGYFDWLLPEIGADKDSKRKGDAPTGKGAFLQEGMALLDAATNKPINSNDPYLLLRYWFPELLDDYLKFNQKNTQTSNLTMADMQALVGCVKMLFVKVRQPSDLTAEVFDYLFN